MTMLHMQGCACPGCSSAPTGERPERAHDAGTEMPAEAMAAKPVYSQAGIIEALTKMGGGHGSIAWNGQVVSYSIGTGRLATTHPGWESEHAGYAGMTPAMKHVAAQAFELWDDVIAISLVERPNSSFANITFNYSAATYGATYTEYSYYLRGGRADHSMADADIWFATGWSTHDEDRDLYQGGYGISTYIHEIGHALGLSHPGRYNFRASFAADATHFQDTRAYTAMSYFNAHENGSGADHVGTNGRSYAATPLLHDILAAQALYGADMTTRTGATTYGFDSTAGRDAFDFVKNPDPVVAIWDAGGIDTIDVSGWDTDQIVDLTEGAFSSVGYLTNNLAIAYRTVIENAAAGGGNDVLIGNAAANVLRGGAGDDRLHGHGGNDVLWGGAGADQLDGGNGIDWVRHDPAGGSVAVDLASGVGAGQAAGDTYAAVENAAGSDDTDLLNGDTGDNQLEGLGGHDLLRGGGGRDMLYGGTGNDTLEGGGHDDRLIGDTGDDLLEGDAGRDYLIGGAGIDMASYHGGGSAVVVNLARGIGSLGDAWGDRLVQIEDLHGSAYDDTLYGSGTGNLLRGGAGDDLLIGLAGNDRLQGGPGADRLNGHYGTDWVLYGDSGEGIAIDLARGFGKGGDAEGDRYWSVENVAGSAADDVLIGTAAANRLEGDSGDDRLFGGIGNDTLVGDAGDDVLEGSRGADLLKGGPGADLFLFARLDGRDRIDGFELAQDVIRFIGAVAAFDQLAITDSSAGASIGYGRGDLILLASIGASELSEELFLFG